MTNYEKGRKNEYRTMELLEASGYLCVRAAGSHSPFDVVGIGSTDIVLVQCKSNEWPSPAERETLAHIRVPTNARKLVHRWDDRARTPRLMEIQ